MELGRQQSPPVFLNAVSCSRSPQCWFFGALRHPRRLPAISAQGSSAALQGSSMSGVLSLDNMMGPRSQGGLQGCQVLPHLLTVALVHVWRSHSGSQTSTQMVSYVTSGCVTVRSRQWHHACLVWGRGGLVVWEG